MGRWDDKFERHARKWANWSMQEYAQHDRVLTKIIEELSDWGAEVEHLRKQRSSGPITARAVVLLDQLDLEIRRRSNGRYSLDDVTRELMTIRKVSLQDLRQATVHLIGNEITALNSPLLR